MDTKLRYEVGSTIGNYKVERVEWLDHLKGTYYELTHQPTGARHIHVDAPDESNAFVVEFPTVPRNSRGVAHILEHVVLAGSQKFPVRDPFFSMVSRSIKDFMNAMTFYASTAYPFSTRNRKDYFNLLDVYLDACFFPRIAEASFQQEGHRLEFDVTEDANSGLKIKGVVFNEMKGAMASSEAVMSRAIGKALLPGSTYANNSGGDPSDIPDLTWQDLKDFHSRHYHPSNASFYTYGDIPLDDILAHIEANALSKFTKIDVDVEIPTQKRFEAPVEFRDVYPLSAEEDPTNKAEVLVSWLTANMTDPFEALSFEVLSEVLLGNAAAPLYKALIDSGLGSALATGTGFGNQYKEAVFSAGLKDADAAKAKEIEQVVIDALTHLAENGVGSELVEAAIHQFELHTREVSNTGFPYSLKVWFMLKASYEYGGDPYRALQMDSDFKRLRSEVAKGGFFENLIKTRLLDNPHRAVIIVEPDQQLADRQDAAEAERIAKLEAALTDEDRKQILESTIALKADQDAKHDISVLPTLELTDVPLTVDEPELDIRNMHGATVAFSEQPTNGLSYVSIVADIGSIEDRLRDRLSLFARSVPRTGAGSYDYLKQALRIDSFTGGISASFGVRRSVSGEILQSISLSGKALSRNNAAFVDILKDVLTSLTWDPARLKDIIAEFRAQSEASIVGAGHQYAVYLASSRLNRASALQERVNGITNVLTLKELAKLSAEELDDVIADLQAIAKHAFNASNLKIAVTGGQQDLDELRGLLDGVLAQIAGDVSRADTLPGPVVGDKFAARTVSVPVTYNAKVYETEAVYTHPDSAALLAAGNLMRNTFIHREIREKGGAYGGFAMSSPESGSFTFVSYRDPHVTNTYKVFDAAVDHIMSGQIDDDEVKEAILQALSQTDPLLSPDTRGRNRFFDDLAGYTPEVRSQFKQRLLSLTADDLRSAVSKHLKGGQAALGSVGNVDKLAAGNAELGDVFEIEAI